MQISHNAPLTKRSFAHSVMQSKYVISKTFSIIVIWPAYFTVEGCYLSFPICIFMLCNLYLNQNKSFIFKNHIFEKICATQCLHCTYLQQRPYYSVSKKSVMCTKLKHQYIVSILQQNAFCVSSSSFSRAMGMGEIP